MILHRGKLLVVDFELSAKMKNRAERVADLLIEELSLREPDQKSLTPIVNAFQLILQKPLVISLVGTPISDAGEGTPIVLGHSVRRTTPNPNQFSSHLSRKISHDIKEEKGSKIPIPMNDKNGISLYTRQKERAFQLTYSKLHWHFNCFSSHPGEKSRNSPNVTFGIRDLSAEALHSLEYFVELLQTKSMFKEQFSKRVEDLISHYFNITLKNAVSELGNNGQHQSEGHIRPSFAEVSADDEPLIQIADDLYSDFSNAPITHNADSDSLNPANFVLVTQLPSKIWPHSIRLVFSQSQKVDLYAKLVACENGNERVSNEILNLVQEPILYGRSHYYGHIPFNDTAGFWNLNFARLDSGDAKKKKNFSPHQARRIIYAILSGKVRDYSKVSYEELVEIGNSLSISSFAFHFAGSPFCYLLQVTSTASEANAEDENRIWQQNTLFYASFVRSYSRKFRARLRTALLRAIRVKAHEAVLNNVYSVDDGLFDQLNGACEDLNKKLDNLARAYPIKRFSVIPFRGEVSVQQQQTPSTPITSWDNIYLQLTWQANPYFDFNYLKRERTYVSRIAAEIDYAISNARQHLHLEQSIANANNKKWNFFIQSSIFKYIKHSDLLILISDGRSMYGMNWLDITRNISAWRSPERPIFDVNDPTHFDTGNVLHFESWRRPPCYSRDVLIYDNWSKLNSILSQLAIRPPGKELPKYGNLFFNDVINGEGFSEKFGKIIKKFAVDGVKRAKNGEAEFELSNGAKVTIVNIDDRYEHVRETWSAASKDWSR